MSLENRKVLFQNILPFIGFFSSLTYHQDTDFQKASLFPSSKVGNYTRPSSKTSRTELKSYVKLPYIRLLNRNFNISTSLVPNPFPRSMVWPIKPVQNSHTYFTFLKFFVGLGRPRGLCCRTGFDIICLSIRPSDCLQLVIYPSIRFD